MKKVLEAIGESFLYAVMIVLIFMLLSGIYQRVGRNTKNSGFFGIGYAVVVSGSMEPNLKIDDMIIYQRQKVDSYAPGDIIVYERVKEGGEKKLITHRIVSVDGMTVVAKGDANEKADEPVSFAKVAGRVVFRVPKIGIAVKFIRTKTGMIVTGAAALLLIGVFTAVGVIRKKRGAAAQEPAEMTE